MRDEYVITGDGVWYGRADRGEVIGREFNGGPMYGDRSIPGVTQRRGFAFVDDMTCLNYSTPQESPYGYGCHIIRGPIKSFSHAAGEYDHADYSDRLQQWKGHEAYREAARRAFPEGLTQPFKYGNMKDISAFLSAIYGHKVECLQVLEGCNVGNGYPYFVFVSKKVPAKKPTRTKTRKASAKPKV